MSKERRRHERHATDHGVALKGGAKGRLRDISAGGLSLEMEEIGGMEEGARVEMEIKGLGAFAGDVVRIMDEGLAVEFDLDEEGQADLIAELSGYRSGSGFGDY